MLDNFDPIAYAKEAGGALKFGSGVLGKSTYAVGVLLIASVVAIARLHSDTAIIAALLTAVAAFFGWFTFVLKFAHKHPDVAVLEGAEWSSFHRFQAAAKGFIPDKSQQTPQEPPNSTSIASTEVTKKTDEELNQ